MSYENDYMYAVDRSDEYLAHYGVKGMRWGVRKAIERGQQKALKRHHDRAMKKLAKLTSKANRNSSYYKKRAAALGAGAAAAGGLAIAGTGGVARGMRSAALVGSKAKNALGIALRGGASDALLAASGNVKNKTVSKALESLGETAYTQGDKMINKGTGIATQINNAAGAVEKWGKGHSITRGVDHGLHEWGRNIQARIPRGSTGTAAQKAATTAGMTAWKAGDAVNKANLSNDAIARAGAAATAAGLGIAAARNAYKARHADKYAKKYASQASAWKKEMDKAFAGTRYASNKKRRKR